MSTTPSPEPLSDESVGTEPTAGERQSWMAKHSKHLIIALIVIVVAVAVVAFSVSLSTGSTANAGNSVASGIMEAGNIEGAILTTERMLPGDTATGTVSISNVGDADGEFSLSASDLTDNPADPAFSKVLTLVVKDGSTTIYDGLLADFPQPGSDPENIDLGTWNAGDQHDYTFTVTFDQTAGSEYQGAQTNLTFNWDATESTS